MIVRTTRHLLTVLTLAFVVPAAFAQGTETPPAAPPIAAPVDSTPAPATVTAPTEPTMPAVPPTTESTPAPAPAESTPPPPQQPKKKQRFRIGPEVGVYLPTSSKARNEFGSTWVTLGVGLGSIGQVTAKGQTSLDLQILYQTKGDNHVFLAPLGIGYRTAISQSGPQTTYVGATLDLYLADLRSGLYNVHSGLRTGGGGSLLLGENFGDSGFLEARYLFVSEIKDFDLSGLNITAGYRF